MSDPETDKALNSAMDFVYDMNTIRRPSLDDMVLLQQIYERREEQRRAAALDGGRAKLRDALALDIGTLMVAAGLSIGPRDGDYEKLVREKLNTDPMFRSMLQAFLHTIVGWIDLERKRCVSIVREFDYEDCTVIARRVAESRSEWPTGPEPPW